MQNLDNITEALDELKQMLLECHPQMPVLLQKIHKQLASDPAQVTLLTTEQVHSLIQALEIQTNTILEEVSAPKKRAKKTITADDL